MEKEPRQKGTELGKRMDKHVTDMTDEDYAIIRARVHPTGTIDQKLPPLPAGIGFDHSVAALYKKKRNFMCRCWKCIFQDLYDADTESKPHGPLEKEYSRQTEFIISLT